MISRWLSLRFVSIVCLLGTVLVAAGPQARAQDDLNYFLPPNYGMVELHAGFSNDPVEIFAVAGGDIDAGRLNLGNGCIGYTTEAPTYRVHWSGRSNALRFVFDGSDDSDTTLIVNEPQGRWYCNDDSFNTYSPTVTISSPSEGQFDIWVGSYNRSAVAGFLYITEMDVRPGRIDNLREPSTQSVNLSGSLSGVPSTADFNAYQNGEDAVDQKSRDYCSGTEPQVGRYMPTDDYEDASWVLSGFRSDEMVRLMFYQGNDLGAMRFYGYADTYVDDDGRAWFFPNVTANLAVVVYGSSSRCIVSWPPYVTNNFSF